ncbi:MAG: nucleoside monophosphate kinase [Candidatus Paceibacterota bacterium]
MREKERIFLLYGPPGSGKTTVGEEVEQRSGGTLKYLSVGKITRGEITRQSEMGMKLKEYLEKVEEYPPTLIGELVRKHILEAAEAGGAMIVDGFPKYPAEAPYFLKIIEEGDFSLKTIIILDISREESLERTAKRRICQNCQGQFSLRNEEEAKCPFCGNSLCRRDDDEKEILMRRYNDYYKSIGDTLNVLGSSVKRTVHINGESSFGKVLEEVWKVINISPE